MKSLSEIKYKLSATPMLTLQIKCRTFKTPSLFLTVSCTVNATHYICFTSMYQSCFTTAFATVHIFPPCCNFLFQYLIPFCSSVIGLFSYTFSAICLSKFIYLTSPIKINMKIKQERQRLTTTDPASMTRIRSLSMTVCRRWAIVNTVQSVNLRRIVFWINSSVLW
jgi:hypothetical protein